MKSSSKEIFEFQNEITEDSASENSLNGRLLHVYYDDWLLRSAKVLDADKTTLMYTIDLKCRKSNMKIHSSASNSQVGEVKFHLLSSRIDTTVHSQEISLTSQGCSKQAYSYTSPARGHTTLSWKARSRWGNPLNLILFDESGLPLARFQPASWAMKKAGKLELLGSSSESGQLMDEVVVTGLAVAQLRHQQMMATYGGSSAASSVAAALA